MLRNLTLSISLLISCVGFAQDQEERDIAGRLRRTSRYDAACACDSVKEYHPNGQLLSVSTYRTSPEGRRELSGLSVRYYENGKVAHYSNWVNGQPEGRQYRGDENGRIRTEEYYREGWKSGTWKFWDADGKLEMTRVYADRKTRTYDTEETVTVQHYRKGKPVYTEQFEKGEKRSTRIVDPVLYRQIQAEQAAVGGKQLFQQHCQACHLPNKDLVGPRLAGVGSRRSQDWLHRYIRDAGALRRSGDKASRELYEKWNRMEHPRFPLKKQEIQRIIDYIKAQPE